MTGKNRKEDIYRKETPTKSNDNIIMKYKDLKSQFPFGNKCFSSIMGHIHRNVVGFSTDSFKISFKFSL